MESLNNSGVVFKADTHQYFLGEKELQGITGTLIPAIFGDYTKNIPADILRRAAEYGTGTHEQIQSLDELRDIGMKPFTPAGAEYVRLRDELKLEYVTSEYIVTDGRHFASPIDKVYEGDIIADIKTTSELHYPQACFQLSWYAAQYKAMNGRAVKKAYIFWLPKKQYGESQAVEVQLVAPSAIKDIVREYVAGRDVTKYANLFAMRLPMRASQVIAKIRHKQALAEKYEKECADMKQMLVDAFSLMGVKKFENDEIAITRIAPTERTTLDTKAVQTRYPNVWEECKRTSVTKESIRITIKN